MEPNGDTAPTRARQLAHLVGPLHNVSYYAPEVRDFDAVGMKGWWMAYFAYRSAPFGLVPVEVVISSFYGFAPRMVRRALPEAWDYITPDGALELRLDIVDRALRRILGDDVRSAPIAEAAELAGRAIAGCTVGARPLFAAHTALEWPEAPHLRLWHAATLLREHRGDSHIIALAAAGLGPVDCHVVMAARGHGNRASILPIRGWTEEEWSEAEQRLVQRGWLDADGALTEEGRAGRSAVERHTDELSAEPWQRLGDTGAARLLDLLGPLVERLHREGSIPLQWPPPHLIRADG